MCLAVILLTVSVSHQAVQAASPSALMLVQRGFIVILRGRGGHRFTPLL